MKNDFKHKINCLTFPINTSKGKRFELSISDVGRGSKSFKEVLIWDAEFQSEITEGKGGFRDDFQDQCWGINSCPAQSLHEVILKAVKHCNNVLMNEMIEDGDERFITLD
mgnify:CR=1 FL=1